MIILEIRLDVVLKSQGRVTWITLLKALGHSNEFIDQLVSYETQFYFIPFNDTTQIYTFTSYPNAGIPNASDRRIIQRVKFPSNLSGLGGTLVIVKDHNYASLGKRILLTDNNHYRINYQYNIVLEKLPPDYNNNIVSARLSDIANRFQDNLHVDSELDYLTELLFNADTNIDLSFTESLVVNEIQLHFAEENTEKNYFWEFSIYDDEFDATTYEVEYQ